MPLGLSIETDAVSLCIGLHIWCKAERGLLHLFQIKSQPRAQRLAVLHNKNSLFQKMKFSRLYVTTGLESIEINPRRYFLSVEV